MSLYSDYIKERTSKIVLETPKGFATYYFYQTGCYIEDIYVAPDYRNEGVAADLADQITKIAKEKGSTHLYGTICPSAKHCTDGLKILLAYGFELDSCVNNLIAFKKVI